MSAITERVAAYLTALGDRRLPPLAEVARSLGCSKSAVHKAMKALEREGRLPGAVKRATKARHRRAGGPTLKVKAHLTAAAKAGAVTPSKQAMAAALGLEKSQVESAVARLRDAGEILVEGRGAARVYRVEGQATRPPLEPIDPGRGGGVVARLARRLLAELTALAKAARPTPSGRELAARLGVSHEYQVRRALDRLTADGRVEVLERDGALVYRIGKHETRPGASRRKRADEDATARVLAYLARLCRERLPTPSQPRIAEELEISQNSLRGALARLKRRGQVESGRPLGKETGEALVYRVDGHESAPGAARRTGGRSRVTGDGPWSLGIASSEAPAAPRRPAQEAAWRKRAAGLRFRTCQYIAGAATADEACKCGRPTENGGPWCDQHLPLIWSKAPPKDPEPQATRKRGALLGRLGAML